MITPPELCAGDKVAVLSPAGFTTIEKNVPGIALLESWGLVPVPGKHMYHRSGIFAGEDKERLSDLAEALENPEIKAIFSSRGGYGSMRLLPELSRIVPSHPKWVTGFSDITALHVFLGKEWQWKSIHGPIISAYKPNNPFSESSFDALRRILFGMETLCRFSVDPLDRPENVSGEMIGGNLSVLYSMRGTPYDMDPAGKILFIEDVGEFDYHLDRMLTNFRQGGIFSRLRGLVIGDFSEIKEGNHPFGKSLPEIVHEAISDTRFPVFFGFPSGHGDQNHPVILGAKGIFEVTGTAVSFRQEGN